MNWQQSVRANEYEVEYRLDADNSTTVFVAGTGYDILDSQVGQYYVAVRAVGYDLTLSAQVSGSALQRLQPSMLLAKAAAKQLCKSEHYANRSAHG